MVDAKDGIAEKLAIPGTSGVRLRLEEYEIKEPLASLFEHGANDITLEGDGDTKRQVTLSGPDGGIAPAHVLRLDNIRLLRASGTAFQVQGWLVLRGGAAIEGPVNVTGRVSYVLPAPHGMHVPVGMLERCLQGQPTSPCRESDTHFIDIRVWPSTTSELFEGLPLNCSAGRLGDRDDVGLQRRGTCSRPCPAGHYCPEGSSTARPCPAGTFNPTQGGSSDAACIACPRGSACKGGEPGGAGATQHELCRFGTYQSAEGGSACKDCPEGKS